MTKYTAVAAKDASIGQGAPDEPESRSCDGTGSAIAVGDALKTIDAAIDEIAALRMERDDWKGRYETLLAIWEELRAENKLLTSRIRSPDDPA